MYSVIHIQDIFETKIASSSLRLCFPNYYGNNTYKEGSEFIQVRPKKRLFMNTEKSKYFQKQFLQLRRNSKRQRMNYKLTIVKIFSR